MINQKLQWNLNSYKIKLTITKRFQSSYPSKTWKAALLTLGSNLFNVLLETESIDRSINQSINQLINLENLKRYLSFFHPNTNTLESWLNIKWTEVWLRCNKLYIGEYKENDLYHFQTLTEEM